jgi:hypothetical protein
MLWMVVMQPRAMPKDSWITCDERDTVSLGRVIEIVIGSILLVRQPASGFHNTASPKGAVLSLWGSIPLEVARLEFLCL